MPHSSVVLNSPVLMLFQISSVTASAPPADALTCKLKTWNLVRVFKLPNFKARGELVLGFWWHINPPIPYKKLMLQGYFLARDHFLRMKSICEATFPRLLCDEMAVIFLLTCVPKKQVDFVCVVVLQPSQPNGVMSSAVSLPNHTFTGQA